ncbi:hypothetical protein GCM10025872_18860 [Barrientosiimonas endolithica]|uniref:4Fe-4S ferredoxin-type domain-containing protein n=1 Tax=Barrientosiimonas endolithica TaxID=1535208 RepID=A0ABM8HBB3_9MICO|nr:hypothetical protein GCM10025872_18860 [Barrientosiimonas endolithica]
MADPRGFLTVRERQLPQRRPVPVRIKDWREVYEEQERGELQRQAGRCMDCGIPFCHQGCPLGNLIPEWNDLARKGEWDDGIERLHATNNFPEFTGRLCPAPCESACVLGISQDPVTIKQVELRTIEEAFEAGTVVPEVPERLTGKTVAVIGSGPAGLAAAQQLTRAGHTVAVYERADKPGGLMRYGIPEFKMEKSVLDRRLEQMTAEGTRFRCGTEVGKDITGEQLRQRYDAVLLATGATVPRGLPVEGGDLDGVVQAMDYLPDANRVALGETVEDQILATDKDVVIIGGGDTGADCLGTAIRQGARSITSLEIMPQPGSSAHPLTRGRRTPCCSVSRAPTRRAATGSTPPAPSRCSPTSRARCARCGSSRSSAPRPAASRRSRAPSGRSPRSWCCSRWASSAPRARASSSSWSWRPTTAPTSRATGPTSPTSRACSSPATRGAVSR